MTCRFYPGPKHAVVERHVKLLSGLCLLHPCDHASVPCIGDEGIATLQDAARIESAQLGTTCFQPLSFYFNMSPPGVPHSGAQFRDTRLLLP